MPRKESTAPLPETIAGLWSLCALAPLKSRAACGEAADVCARLSVRRLNAAYRESTHTLTALRKGRRRKALIAHRPAAFILRTG